MMQLYFIRTEPEFNSFIIVNGQQQNTHKVQIERCQLNRNECDKIVFIKY